jgi:hypothetical protein
VTAVVEGPGFAAVVQPSGITVGPATITIDGETELELELATPTSRPRELLGSEMEGTPPPTAPPTIYPCLVLVNLSGSTIEQLLVVNYDRLTDNSELSPVLNGPIHEIRGELALIETLYGDFTVPIAQEVDTTLCGGRPIEALVPKSPQQSSPENESFSLFLNDAGQIGLVACGGPLDGRRTVNARGNSPQNSGDTER